MSPPDDSKKAEILVEVSIVCTCCVVSVESRGRLIVAVMLKLDAVQKARLYAHHFMECYVS